MCHKSCQQCLEAIALSSSAPRDDSSENVKNGLERDGRAAARSHEKWRPLFLLCSALQTPSDFIFFIWKLYVCM